jgi:hypothetical protein
MMLWSEGEPVMKNVAGGLRSCVLALVALTAAGTAPAALDDSGTPAEAMVATPASDQQKPLRVTDPGWQPPTAREAVIPSPLDPKQAEKIAKQWGVKLISLNLSAAGYMMDFRFRVLDADKASSFFDHRIKPYVLAERSNAKLPVPMANKVGALRPTNRGQNIKAGKNYYMMFANPDRHVKKGEQITLVIGDFKVEHLTVN